MKNISGIAQLILRFAIGIGFLIPVMDRIGLIGSNGSDGVSWGDWKHFLDYTHTLVPFASASMTNIMALLATIVEGVSALCLIIGFRIKEAALGAGHLTLVFGLCMAIFLTIRAPFDYPVFVFTGGALLLSSVDKYKWSVDDYMQKRRLN
jgi:putative oxidoreductase